MVKYHLITVSSFAAGFCLLNRGFYLFIHIKGSTLLSETDFCKIMEFLADYLKMIKLYEKVFCDSGMQLGVSV